jgi:hypothetical protein
MRAEIIINHAQWEDLRNATNNIMPDRTKHYIQT